jgi:hypothetical protein
LYPIGRNRLFEPQIIHAKELISRLERCHRESFKVPDSVPVSLAEYNAWYLGIERLINSAFGEHSTQVEQWRQLKLHLGDMIGQSIQDSADGSAIPGYVNYYNACVVFLQSLGSDGGPSPDSFAKAVFALLWPSQQPLRVAIVVIVVLAVGAFTLWTSLPDASKTSVIRWLLSR